jgi:4-hydroxymandelate synthase
MEILGLDHVEVYVPDLEQAIRRFVGELGFVVTGRRGPGEAPEPSVALGCGTTSLVCTGPANGGGPVAEFLRRHDEGVANIALRTSDAAGAFEAAVGALDPLAEPTSRSWPGEGEGDGGGDAEGEVATVAAVRAFGDVALTFVERSDPGPGARLPLGFSPVGRSADADQAQAGFDGIDHLAVCLPAADLLPTAARWIDQLGFVRTFEERVSVGGQAMDSVVIQDPAGALVLTLLAQDPAMGHGQVARFVEANGGAGVQHVAFRTPHILDDVERLRARGVELLRIPPTYYEKLLANVGDDLEEVERLRHLGVLRDRDLWGTIFQVFTRSTHPRDTLFFELVERRGARTFGSGNIKALYEAVGRGEPEPSRVPPE